MVLLQCSPGQAGGEETRLSGFHLPSWRLFWTRYHMEGESATGEAGMGEGIEIAGITAPANARAVTGQRVLITGASSGLGLAMARALAEGGARVVLGGRDEGRLAEALRSLGDGADARAVPLLLQAPRGKIVNISMNHETMRRRGFVPYGPSRASAESLALIMAEDLRPHGVDVNMLLPGGATATGMIPDDVPQDVRARLLSPDVMAEPILYLCSHASDGVTGARIVAIEFASWLRERQAG